MSAQPTPARRRKRAPRADWQKAMLWACLFGICIGFWVGVVVMAIEVAH